MLCLKYSLNDIKIYWMEAKNEDHNKGQWKILITVCKIYDYLYFSSLMIVLLIIKVHFCQFQYLQKRSLAMLTGQVTPLIRKTN